jgi:hypothetical protein
VRLSTVLGHLRRAVRAGTLDPGALGPTDVRGALLEAADLLGPLGSFNPLRALAPLAAPGWLVSCWSAREGVPKPREALSTAAHTPSDPALTDLSRRAHAILTAPPEATVARRLARTLSDPDDRITALVTLALGRLAAAHRAASEALLAAWPLDLAGRPLTAAATLRAISHLPGDTSLQRIRTLTEAAVLDPRWRSLAQELEDRLTSPGRAAWRPSDEAPPDEPGAEPGERQDT